MGVIRIRGHMLEPHFAAMVLIKMRRIALNSLRPLQDIMLETNAMYRWVNAHPLIQFASRLPHVRRRRTGRDCQQ